jgi:hypothetical protein
VARSSWPGASSSSTRPHHDGVPQRAVSAPVLASPVALLHEAEPLVQGACPEVPGPVLQLDLVRSRRPSPLERLGQERGTDPLPAVAVGDVHAEADDADPTVHRERADQVPVDLGDEHQGRGPDVGLDRRAALGPVALPVDWHLGRDPHALSRHRLAQVEQSLQVVVRGPADRDGHGPSVRPASGRARTGFPALRSRPSGPIRRRIVGTRRFRTPEPVTAAGCCSRNRPRHLRAPLPCTGQGRRSRTPGAATAAARRRS